MIDFVIKASYGNDSVALIQWCFEHDLENVVVLYNDTGWAADGWNDRVRVLESWVQSLGFEHDRTKSIGLEALVRQRKGWPRQGIQFCTQELKIKPSLIWWDENAGPLTTSVVGVRRMESANRSSFPEWSFRDDVHTWAPLVTHTDEQRDVLLSHADVEPLPHRSMECFPCINSNRGDLLLLADNETRIKKIEVIEASMGERKTMFRPYRYMGATGIREIVRWAQSPRGKFESLDDGNGSPGCETECGR